MTPTPTAQEAGERKPGHRTLWWVGQAASMSVGFAVGATYTWAAGLAVAYALFMLVDIRDNTERPTRWHQEDE